jgi:DNA polymerase-4
MTRQIIHLDLDAFYCAVEEQRDPSLRGKPFAVGGRPNARGVVASCSYPARARGVRSAMPMSRAVRLCPELIIIGGHYSLYAEASRRVMEKLRAVTPLVEQLSIDEAFLEITGQPAEETARRIQQAINDEFRLPCSLGVASNKLVAKIASDHGKGQHTGDGPPNAITIVKPGTEAAFLAPLGVRALWGVGPKTEARLHAAGIATIGELAAAPQAELTRLFGRHGADIARRARGLDDAPIVTERETKSISQEITFPRDVTDAAVLHAQIAKQSARVAGSLQKEKLTAATIRLKLRWQDFTTLTRQTTLAQPTADPALIAEIGAQLLDKVWTDGRPVRLLGIGVSGLGSQSRQLGLWEAVTSNE